MDYRQRIEDHFNSTDMRSMWQGIRALTDYKNSHDPVYSKTTLSNEFSNFFTWFDNNDSGKRTTIPAAEAKQPMALSIKDVQCTLQRFNPHKATGPDGIPAQGLKDVLYNWLEFSPRFSTCLWHLSQNA